MTATHAVRGGAKAAGTLTGIGLMLLGIFLFSANDALGKWLVSNHSVGQLVLIRSIATVLVLAPFVWRAGFVVWRAAPRPGLQVARAALASVEVAAFYGAVAELPLAEVMTYYLAGPLYVTAMSPLLLGEHIGWRRWTAVIVGFVGVVVALDATPTSLGWGTALALFGSFAFALLLVSTRKLAATSGLVLISGQTVAALVCGGTLAAFHWTPITATGAGLMAFLGIVAMVATLCVNRALQIAPASVVAPFEFMLIVWGALFGYLFFGETLSWKTAVGATIIVASGIYIILREHAVGRQITSSPDVASTPHS